MKVPVWCVMILTIALEPVRGDAYRQLAAQHEKAVAMHTYIRCFPSVALHDEYSRAIRM